MWQFLLKTLIIEIVGAIAKMASDYIKLREKKKQDAETVKMALSERDPKKRAENIRNLLS